MKKLLLLILVFIFIISSVSVSYAVPDDLWNGDERIESLYALKTESKTDILYKLLVYLDMINAEDFKSEGNVTVGDFTKAFAKILGVTDSSGSEEAFEALKTSGAVRNEMKSNAVTFDDLVYTGLFTTGHIKTVKSNAYGLKAKEADLLYNLDYKPNSKVTKKEFIQFIYNVLSIPTLETDEISKGGLTIKYKNAYPILKRFDIELKNGIVTSAPGCSMYTTDLLKKNNIEIDKVRYELYDTELSSEKTGYHVFYFTETKNEKTRVLFMEKSIKNNEIVIENTKELKFYSDRVEYLNGEEKEKTARIQSGARVIYNGISMGNYYEGLIESLVNKESEIILNDNDANKRADVIFVWNYLSYSVSNDVGDFGILSFKYGMLLDGKNYIDLKNEYDDRYIEITEKDKAVDYTDIKKDDIVSIAKSLNTSGVVYYKIKLSKLRISGVISEIRDDKYVIDSIEYSIKSEYLSAAEKNPEMKKPALGENYVIGLDFKRNIADLNSDIAYKLGYFIKAANDGDAFEKTPKIKIFTSDGEMVIYDISEKVRYFDSSYPNGTSMKNDALYTKLSTRSLTDIRSLVYYRCDENGKLNEIYLPVDNTSNIIEDYSYPLTYDITIGDNGDGTVGKHYFYQNVLKHKYNIPASVPVFKIPTDPESEDEMYVISALSDWTTNGDIQEIFHIYGLDKYFRPKALVLYSDTGAADAEVDSDDDMMIVKSVSQVRTEKGYQALKISGWKNGSSFTSITGDAELLTDDQNGWKQIKLKDLQFGDLIQYNTDASSKKIGDIKVARLLFSPSDKGEVRYVKHEGDESYYGNGQQRFSLVYGRFMSNEGNLMRLDMTKSTDSSASYAAYSGANSTVYIVDTKNKTLTPASLSDLYLGDELVAKKRWAQLQYVYVFR